MASFQAAQPTASAFEAAVSSIAAQMTQRGLTAVSAFRVMDRDKDGSVTAAELHRWCGTVGIRSSPDEARAVARQLAGGARSEFGFRPFAQAIQAHKRAAFRATRRGDTSVPDRRRGTASTGPRIQSTSQQRASVEGEFGGAEATNLGLVGKTLFLKSVTPQFSMFSDEDLQELWDQHDNNGNGLVSLAEIDKVIVERFPALNIKPALMRAYKFADADGNGFITKREFRLLMRSLVYFQQLWRQFAELDTDGDRRIDIDEFRRGSHLLGLDLSPEEVDATFNEIDGSDGGMILFNEFCSYMSRLKADQAEQEIAAAQGH